MRQSKNLPCSAVPQIFGNQEMQYLEVIKQMLLSSLTDTTSYDVRFAAVKASVNFLLNHDKESSMQKHFGELLLPVLTVTWESVEKADDEAALKSLIDLAESCPKFLRPQLEGLFAACVKIFSDKEQDDSWRHLALEIVVTLSETAAAMVRKVAGATQLPQAIQVGFVSHPVTHWAKRTRGHFDTFQSSTRTFLAHREAHT